MTFDLMEAARSIIAIDSRSERSSRPVIDLLAPLCRSAGLGTAEHEEVRDGVRQFNLVASRGRLAEDSLLLATHIDTVPPGDHALWTETGGDPFALAERDGDLYGLGVADVKLDVLCKLAALHRLRTQPLGRGVALAATYGEETGRFGARLLVRSLRPLPGTVLVGEPSELRPVGGHKGYVEFRVTASTDRPAPAPDLARWRVSFRGVSAHSSQTDKGVSANSSCLDALTRLAKDPRVAVVSVRGGDVVNKVPALCDAVVASPFPPRVPGVAVSPEPQAGAPPWTPGLVRLLLDLHQATGELRRELARHLAGEYDPPYSTANNGITDLHASRLRYVVDVRRIPGEGPRRALDAYQHELENLARAHPDLTIRVERALDAPPHTPMKGSPLLATVEAVLSERGRPKEREYKSGTTEAPVYQEAGMDALVLGPGTAAANIHRPNERIALSQLFEAVELYAGIITRLCG